MKTSTMDDIVKEEDPDQVLATTSAPIFVDDIPLEALRIYPMPRDDDNVVNKAIYHQLVKQYIAERNYWPTDLQDEFKSEAKRLEYRITRNTGSASGHNINRWMFKQKS